MRTRGIATTTITTRATWVLSQLMACPHRIDAARRIGADITSIIHPMLLKDCHLPGEFDAYDPIMPILVVEDIGFGLENTVLFLSKEHLFKDASYFHIIRHVNTV